ncbi:hypothetical protein [Cerasicoccus frondis]|uniref:hypothetical protein n=1 Tax=Cerasicoccus frondis TaxID=490090 RepID=UPI002852B52E|nr:hypothetical protein [Cerasicoccus frondis]
MIATISLFIVIFIMGGESHEVYEVTSGVQLFVGRDPLDDAQKLMTLKVDAELCNGSNIQDMKSLYDLFSFINTDPDLIDTVGEDTLNSFSGEVDLVLIDKDTVLSRVELTVEEGRIVSSKPLQSQP